MISNLLCRTTPNEPYSVIVKLFSGKENRGKKDFQDVDLFPFSNRVTNTYNNVKCNELEHAHTKVDLHYPQHKT